MTNKDVKNSVKRAYTTNEGLVNPSVLFIDKGPVVVTEPYAETSKLIGKTAKAVELHNKFGEVFSISPALIIAVQDTEKLIESFTTAD